MILLLLLLLAPLALLLRRLHQVLVRHQQVLQPRNMADVKEIFGVKQVRDEASTASFLLAQVGTSIYDVDNDVGFPININKDYNLPASTLPTEKSSFEQFLDYIFHVNGRGPNLTLDIQDPSAIWGVKNIAPTPLAKYVQEYNDRLYLANVRYKIIIDTSVSPNTNERYVSVNPVFKNRVFFSDFPEDRDLTWGFGFGVVQNFTADDNASFTSITSTLDVFGKVGHYFISNNIKAGDPIFFNNNNEWFRFTVESVATEYKLNLVPGPNQGVSLVSAPYWVGGNFFDVPSEPGDEITGTSVNNNNLIIFQQRGLHRYNGISLRKISNIGTSSPQSIVTLNDLTFYFHGADKQKTGFYIYNGVRPKRISQPVQPFIDGISSSNYDTVVGWIEGNLYRAYVGNISNSNSSVEAHNIEIANGVFTYDITTGATYIDSVTDVLRSAATVVEDNVEKVFIGNDSNEVMQTPSGSSFNGTAISMKVSKGPVYPRGSDVINVFTRVQIISRDGFGITARYRLWDRPFDIDDKWRDLGNLRSDKEVFEVPHDHSRSSGIEIEFNDHGARENNPVIEQITIFSYPETDKTPEITELR